MSNSEAASRIEQPLPNIDSNRAVAEFNIGRSNPSRDFGIYEDRTQRHGNRVVRVIMSHTLSLRHDAQRLARFLQEQTKIMPQPRLRIRGWHRGSESSDGCDRFGRVVDFDLTISLRDQLAKCADLRVVSNSTMAYRGTSERKTLTDSAKPSLVKYCRDFCSSQDEHKSFTFSRTVANLDHTISIQSIHRILRDVNYKGNIEVTVEVEDHRTILISDRSLNYLTLNGHRWSSLYVTKIREIFGKLHSRWEVLTLKWPAARPEGEEAREMAAAWVEKWRVAIARAALERLKGRLYSSERNRGGAPWKALGDFDGVEDWGMDDVKRQDEGNVQ
ncbi:hypothetical protein ACLMJK_004646 [Lecanora helva]